VEKPSVRRRVLLSIGDSQEDTREVCRNPNGKGGGVLEGERPREREGLESQKKSCNEGDGRGRLLSWNMLVPTWERLIENKFRKRLIYFRTSAKRGGTSPIF